jgi:cephalosporin-C deacetylase
VAGQQRGRKPTKNKVPSTRAADYRCSLPGLAGFASVTPPGTKRISGTQDHSSPALVSRFVRRLGSTRALFEEREGFEPSEPHGSHDFQSCAFDHSAISPTPPAHRHIKFFYRGEGGIRTLVGRKPKPDFESGAFDQLDHLSRNQGSERMPRNRAIRQELECMHVWDLALASGTMPPMVPTSLAFRPTMTQMTFLRLMSSLAVAVAVAPIDNAWAQGTGPTAVAAGKVVSVSPLKLEVSLDRANWTYALGESAKFSVRALRDGSPVPGTKIHYAVGFEKMPPLQSGDAVMNDSSLSFETGAINSAGFVACEVEVELEGRTYKGRAAAGFSPEKILPSVQDPKDFDEFWQAGRKQLAALAIDARVLPAPERSAPGVDCSTVSLQNVGQGKQPSAPKSGPTPSRFYGVLCEPQGPGPFPALLLVPGAGVRSYKGSADLAAKGIITLTVGIHGVPVNMEDEVYDSLSKGALANYPSINSDDKDLYYYRRVYLGAVRGNDFLVTRPRWDKHHLGVMGGSQGGALAITTAGLDKRVTALVSYYPALSDHAGFLNGRTGGWPFLLRQEEARTPARTSTLAYFDVVNFARRVNAPGFYSWGYNDETCPPTSTFAAYNVVKAPKVLTVALANGHNTTPEQSAQAEEWLWGRLGIVIKKPPAVANK